MQKTIDELSQNEIKKIQQLELGVLKEIDRLCRKHDITYSLTGGTLLGAVRHKGFIPWDDDVDIALPRKDYYRLMEICKTELDEKYSWQCHENEEAWFRLYAKIRVNGTVFKELAHCKHNINHGVYIDVFALDNVPDNMFKQKLQKLQFMICNSILSAKYINDEYRSGKNKVIAKVLKFAFSPLSLENLYHCAKKILTKYDTKECKCIMNYNGAYGDKEIFPYDYFVETIELPFEDTKLMCSKYYDSILTQLYGNYMELPPLDKRKSLHKVVELSLDESSKNNNNT